MLHETRRRRSWLIFDVRRMEELDEKLKCGPRAIMLMASRVGVEISREELWTRFRDDLSSDPENPGAVSISTLIDMARAFRLARHVDLTHEIPKVDAALRSSDVTGVLVSWERSRLKAVSKELSPHYHIARLHSIEKKDDVYRAVQVESPSWRLGNLSSSSFRFRTSRR